MKRRRGAAMVEFALLLIPLMVILLGIIEFSLILNDRTMLIHAAHEGARTAALKGQSVSETVKATVDAAKPAVVEPGIVRVDYCSDGSSANWIPATEKPDSPGILDNTGNEVPKNAMIRVSITGYRHALVTGSFFISRLTGLENGRLEMSAWAVRRRE